MSLRGIVTPPSQYLIGKRTEPVYVMNQLQTCVLCLERPTVFPCPGQVLPPMGLLLPSEMESVHKIQNARNYELGVKVSVLCEGL